MWGWAPTAVCGLSCLSDAGVFGTPRMVQSTNCTLHEMHIALTSRCPVCTLHGIRNARCMESTKGRVHTTGGRAGVQHALLLVALLLVALLLVAAAAGTRCCWSCRCSARAAARAASVSPSHTCTAVVHCTSEVPHWLTTDTFFSLLPLHPCFFSATGPLQVCTQ